MHENFENNYEKQTISLGEQTEENTLAQAKIIALEEDVEHITGDPITDFLRLTTKAKSKMILAKSRGYSHEDIYAPLQEFFSLRGDELTTQLASYTDDNMFLQLLAQFNGDIDDEMRNIITTDTQPENTEQEQDKAKQERNTFFESKAKVVDQSERKAFFIFLLLTHNVSVQKAGVMLNKLLDYTGKKQILEEQGNVISEEAKEKVQEEITKGISALKEQLRKWLNE